MTEVIQILASFVGAVGFAILFGQHGRQIPLAGVGSALVWFFCLAVQWCGGELHLGVFVAALLGSFYSELLAELLKVPKTVFLFSVLISLIPGSDLYLAMRYAIEGNVELFLTHGIRTLTIAFAIALGIIVMVVLTQIRRLIGQKSRPKSK
ncbi:MAG: threonine/serine exporter family protein [Clostridia bacterium]|nr:threonine/serine exporter family protein [Clostridia bacterium]